jgi:hypothetical protein
MGKPLTADEIAEFYRWRETVKKKKGQTERNTPLSKSKVTAWQLRRLGYPLKQVAQILDVGISTITRWDRLVRKEFDELPTARIAIDTIQSLIPKALKAYDNALTCDDPRLRKEAAKDILSNFKILTDRVKLETDDDQDRSDDELIAEAERIIAQATRTPEQN